MVAIVFSPTVFYLDYMDEAEMEIIQQPYH